MGHQRSVFIACAAGALATATLAAAPTSPSLSVVSIGPDAVAPLVVMIRGTFGNAPTAGAGVIIALANDRLYVATANHVIRTGTTEAKEVQVLLQWLPGEWIPARVLEHGDTMLDLAVIAVPEAGRLSLPKFAWQTLTRPESLTPRETRVFPIGYPGGNPWLIPAEAHTVNTVTTSVIRTEGNLAHGHSGGALVTEDGGIVGLVSIVDAVIGESQRIDRIVEKLTEWGYKVALTWKEANAGTDKGRSADPKLQSCEISVTSAPPDADVFVDDRSEGMTPRRLNVARGAVVRVEKAGYEPYSSKVDCMSGSVEPSLRPMITLEYRGDPRCQPRLALQIEKTVLSPTSYPVQISGIPLGPQPYQVSGEFSCSSGPNSCKVVNSEGSIFIWPGALYDVRWNWVGFGNCVAQLFDLRR
jgi:S1-C subfamily serine protease